MGAATTQKCICSNPAPLSPITLRAARNRSQQEESVCLTAPYLEHQNVVDWDAADEVDQEPALKILMTNLPLIEYYQSGCGVNVRGSEIHGNVLRMER